MTDSPILTINIIILKCINTIQARRANPFWSPGLLIPPPSSKPEASGAVTARRAAALGLPSIAPPRRRVFDPHSALHVAAKTANFEAAHVRELGVGGGGWGGGRWID
jgi:hypothetical protein